MEIKKGQITRIFNGEIITPEKNLGIGTDFRREDYRRGTWKL